MSESSFEDTVKNLLKMPHKPHKPAKADEDMPESSPEKAAGEKPGESEK